MERRALLPDSMRPVAGLAPGVSDGVDSQDVAEIAIGDHERKAGHHALPDLERTQPPRPWAGRVKGGDERHGAFDRGVEPLATARIGTLVTSSRGIELDTRSRR